MCIYIFSTPKPFKYQGVSLNLIMTVLSFFVPRIILAGSGETISFEFSMLLYLIYTGLVNDFFDWFNANEILNGDE